MKDKASQLALEFEKLQSDKTLSFDGYWERMNDLILQAFKEVAEQAFRDSKTEYRDFKPIPFDDYWQSQINDK